MDVREAVRQSGFRGYEVANALGFSEWKLSRMLSRSELPKDQKKKVYEAIDSLCQERQERLKAMPGRESD